MIDFDYRNKRCPLLRRIWKFRFIGTNERVSQIESTANLWETNVVSKWKIFYKISESNTTFLKGVHIENMIWLWESHLSTSLPFVSSSLIMIVIKVDYVLHHCQIYFSTWFIVGDVDNLLFLSACILFIPDFLSAICRQYPRCWRW